jgi:uncharacterized RDD family membrane protein YckC
LENSSSSSPEPAAGKLEYVGFWKRFVAAAIDIMILTVVLTPLMIGIYGLSHFDPQRIMSGQLEGGKWDWLIELAIAVTAILFWKFRGATPGKMAISARIVDAKTGGKPSTGKLIVRYIAYIVSTLPLFLGFIWIGIDRRKQGFHDKIAGTLVVYDND